MHAFLISFSRHFPRGVVKCRGFISPELTDLFIFPFQKLELLSTNLGNLVDQLRQKIKS